MKTILAISGSLRKGSSNHNIIRFLAEMVPDDVNYLIYEGLAQLPHFDPGLDNDNPPQHVAELRRLLLWADAVIICTPEYAFGVPGSLKNALDWMVSSDSFGSKQVALITASTGGQYAHASLLLTLGAIGANMQKNATLLISFIRSKMDAEGNVKDEEAVKNLRLLLETTLTANNV